MKTATKRLIGILVVAGILASMFFVSDILGWVVSLFLGAIVGLIAWLILLSLIMFVLQDVAVSQKTANIISYSILAICIIVAAVLFKTCVFDFEHLWPWQ